MQRLLWAGTGVDLVLALCILVPIRPVFDAFGIPIGEPVMYVRFAGLTLVVLPIFYVLGATSASHAPAITAAAALARLSGALFVALHVLFAGAPASFWLFAAIDGVFSIAHTLALGRAGIRFADALRTSGIP